MISPRSVPSALSSGSFLILCVRIVSSACAVSGSPVCAIKPIARRHSRRHRPGLVHEPEVARRQQALHAALGVDDDQRADAGVAHPGRRVGEAGVWRDRVRVADDAVLLALDDLDFPDLRLDLAAAEPAVDDADPAFFRHGNRHLGAGDGIHVGRDDRPLQGEMPREARRQVDGRGVAALDDAVLRGEEEVVEGAAADESRGSRTRAQDSVGRVRRA